MVDGVFVRRASEQTERARESLVRLGRGRSGRHSGLRASKDDLAGGGDEIAESTFSVLSFSWPVCSLAPRCLHFYSSAK